MTDFTLIQNDTYPAFRRILVNEEQKPVDLTDATVSFHMKLQGADVATVDSPAMVDRPAEGSVIYDWQTGDTAVAGVYFAEFEVTYPGGKIETFPTEPYEIYIREELA